MMYKGMHVFLLALLVSLVAVKLAAAQQDRIAGSIDSAQTVVLKGNISPRANPQSDLGALDPATKLRHVTVLLKPSPEQEAERKQLLADQQNPTSPNYHKWLTPEENGERFGLSRADIAKIKRWLRSQGFAIVEVARARNWIAFSGTAGQLEQAFHTHIHRFTVDGEERFANTTDPSIPKALEGIVSGLRGLDNIKAKSMIFKKALNLGSDYTQGGGINSLAPDDLATIYDIAPLYASGIDGTGMKIAIMGQTDVHLTDIQQFRGGFNLSVNNPTTTLATGCTDPGFTADEGEADLDLEWSGAVARNAAITFVICDTTTNSGVLTSLQYAVNNNVAPVISTSYGLCESSLTQSFETTFFEPLVQQAISQGQTLMFSSADDGAAGCDDQNTETVATQGYAVNGFASPPEVTGVGGTEFDADVNNPNTYWGTNGANGGSALSYIPELAWNDGALGTNLNHGIWGTGGGKSLFFSKPTWQTGTGVPVDGARDVPDVAMAASGAHDGYILCTNVGTGGTYVGSCASGIALDTIRVGGTSAAAPVFAGIIVLLNQYLNKNAGTKPGLGNINPTLYALATNQPTAFHDIPAGNYSLANVPSGNIVPCQPGTTSCPTSGSAQFGFPTTKGYDQATGLGSVDANLFVTEWNSSTLAATGTTMAISPQATVTVGTSVTLKATIAPAPPNGETVTFIDTLSGSTLGTGTISSGTATFTSTTIAGGSYNVEAKYPGDTTLAPSNSPGTALNIQDFTLGPSALSITVLSPGQTGTGTITFGLLGGLTSTPTFSCTGLPSESTCSFAATTSTTETISIATTASSWLQNDPLGRGNRIFYALLAPGLFGLVMCAGRRRRSMLSTLGLLASLAVLTLWMPACGGSSTPHNPGTPVGKTTVTVTATVSNITHTIAVSLNVQ